MVASRDRPRPQDDGAFLVRLGWTDRETLGRLLGESSALTALEEDLRELASLAQACTSHLGPGQRSRDSHRILEWAVEPTLAALPTAKLIRGAKRSLAEQAEGRRLLAVAERISRAVGDGAARRSQLDGEIVEFLRRCRRTDLPRRLAWDQPQLTARLFGRPRRTHDVDSGPVVDHGLRQDAFTCVGYALGAVGRLSPRQAWITVGFGRLDPQARSRRIRIRRRDARLTVDPDLAWFDRHLRKVGRATLRPGERPWAYLLRRARQAGDSKEASAWRGAVGELHALSTTLGPRPRLQDILRFQRQTASILRNLVGDALWREDPHTWWVTPILPREYLLQNQALTAIVDELRPAAGETSPKVHPPGRPPRPYPLRVKERKPEAVLLEAEEFSDWIVEDVGLPLRQGMRDSEGVIFEQDSDGYRLRCQTPNPGRAGERFALMLDEEVAFCRPGSAVPLQPPRTLIDNRLARTSGREIPPWKVSRGAAAVYRSSLLTPETEPLLALELASPAYRAAPDLAPHLVRREKLLQVRCGILAKDARCWLLRPGELGAARPTMAEPARLAHLYFLEIHRPLGSPSWLRTVVDGRRSTLPVRSLLAWSHLMRLLRRTRRPAALLAPIPGCARPPLLVRNGRPLVAEFVYRRFDRTK